MKILQINKFFYKYGRAGGAGRYLFRLIELLESKGHKIISFGMRDKYTIPSPYLDYFVSEIDISKVRFGWQGIKTAARIIWSGEAKRKIENLIQKTKPDIAHLHNIYHQISPSILPILKKYNIPIVQSVHDFKLICPNYSLFIKGKPCERCNTYKYYNAVIRRCLKNSLLASSLACLEMYIHRFLLHIYERNVDLFIAPSKFVKDELTKFKVDADKITILPHFLDIKNFEPKYEFENNIVYFGRLSQGKGIKILIDAFRKLRITHSTRPRRAQLSRSGQANYKLQIIGTGPQEDKLKQYVEENKIENVKFLGFLSGNKLASVIQKAMFVVVPSAVFETFGLTCLEAFAFGKPVIGTNIGAIPELIDYEKNGLIFKSGDINDLANKMRYLIDNKDKIVEMGKKAREKVEKEYGPEKHYQKLIEIYKKLLK